MIELLLFLCVALPVAWLVSEVQSRRWISVVLGMTAILIVGFVAYAWAEFTTTFQKNLYFGNANEKLFKALSDEIDGSEGDLVRKELLRLATLCRENYENYPRYDEEVDKFVTRLREAASKDAESTAKSNSTITADGGQVIVSGEYHTSGKFGPFIPLGETSVYLVADGSASWPNLEGQRVEVSGQLRLVPAGISRMDNVARAPELLLLTTTPESIVVRSPE